MVSVQRASGEAAVKFLGEEQKFPRPTVALEPVPKSGSQPHGQARAEYSPSDAILKFWCPRKSSRARRLLGRAHSPLLTLEAKTHGK